MLANILSLDFETLNTKPDSAVLSIGACIQVGKKLHEFYRVVRLEEQVVYGATVSSDTLAWWFTQNQEARDAIAQEVKAGKAVTMDRALCDFLAWLDKAKPDYKTMKVSTNGANFDEPIIQWHLGKNGLSAPWAFWNVICHRTLTQKHRSTPEYKAVVREGAHNAVEDAKYQLQLLSALVEAGIVEL